MNAKLRLLIVSVLLVISTAATLWITRDSSPATTIQPLLTGPPEFVVLGLIVSLGLYLRQVSLHAVELSDSIRLREAWNKPPYEQLRDKKIEQLDETAATIEGVSPFMIAFNVVIAVRIILDSFSRLLGDDGNIRRMLFSFDLVIALALLGILVGLGFAHFDVRRKDKRIRKQLRSEWAKNAAKSNDGNLPAKKATHGVATVARIFITESGILIEYDPT